MKTKSTAHILIFTFFFANAESSFDRVNSFSNTFVETRALDNLGSISQDAIKSQIEWHNDSDIDLHAITPNGKEVNYSNPKITYGDNGRVELDHDNLGGIIDNGETGRFEHIVVDGNAPEGQYKFYGKAFGMNGNAVTPYNLTVSKGDVFLSQQGVFEKTGQITPTLDISYQAVKNAQLSKQIVDHNIKPYTLGSQKYNQQVSEIIDRKLSNQSLYADRNGDTPANGSQPIEINKPKSYSVEISHYKEEWHPWGSLYKVESTEIVTVNSKEEYIRLLEGEFNKHKIASQYPDKAIRNAEFVYEVGSYVPVVGETWSALEGANGENPITGEKLSNLERAWSLVNALPFVGKGSKLFETGKKGVENAQKFVNQRKKIDKELIKTIIDSKEKANSKIKSLARVEKVNRRKPINSDKYAGSFVPLKDLPLEIRKKYPHSVEFTGKGFPDFSRYSIKNVKIRLGKSRKTDNSRADKEAGFNKDNPRPAGYVWHHHHDSGLMQLIPKDLHDAVRHTGGIATSK